MDVLRSPAWPSRVAVFAALSVALTVAPPTHAVRWTIEHPVEKGKQTPNVAMPAPLRRWEADDKALEERHPVVLDRIEVEGTREREFRREPPRTAEQRFADALNEGSPELIAGRSYNGYYYDGTLFWGSDPLSFAWKNVSHWLRH
jgi:hypothetical protein